MDRIRTRIIRLTMKRVNQLIYVRSCVITQDLLILILKQNALCHHLRCQDQQVRPDSSAS
ncbi:hypothetical protein Hanom_Chr12g01138271 [Helianthus anomalus]